MILFFMIFKEVDFLRVCLIEGHYWEHRFYFLLVLRVEWELRMRGDIHKKEIKNILVRQIRKLKHIRWDRLEQLLRQSKEFSKQLKVDRLLIKEELIKRRLVR